MERRDRRRRREGIGSPLLAAVVDAARAPHRPEVSAIARDGIAMRDELDQELDL
jgi:hypothetical protein